MNRDIFACNASTSVLECYQSVISVNRCGFTPSRLVEATKNTWPSNNQTANSGSKSLMAKQCKMFSSIVLHVVCGDAIEASEHEDKPKQLLL